jgi:hypothetical protein
VETSLKKIQAMAPESDINAEGSALPFPTDLSDEPLRAYLGDYGSVELDEGIESTYKNFCKLVDEGILSPDALL